MLVWLLAALPSSSYQAGRQSWFPCQSVSGRFLLGFCFVFRLVRVFICTV